MRGFHLLKAKDILAKRVQELDLTEVELTKHPLVNHQANTSSMTLPLCPTLNGRPDADITIFLVGIPMAVAIVV